MSNSKPLISIIGGDMRQAYLALLLQQQGYCVTCFCVPALPVASPYTTAPSLQDALQDAQWIIGGIPFCKQEALFVSDVPDGQSPIQLTDFLSYLKPHQTLIGGLLPPCVQSYCKEQQITCLDFMKDDSFAIYNAVATAEGSIAEAILHHPSNLQNSPCLVLGYGKCAKILSEKLNALQAKVSVCARKKTDRSYACARGLQSLSFSALPDHIHEFSYIFNTVPDIVLTESILQSMRQDALIIDIASAPGGVDYTAAKKLGIEARLCLGLPGKYAAKASAEGMIQFLFDHITTD